MHLTILEKGTIRHPLPASVSEHETQQSIQYQYLFLSFQVEADHKNEIQELTNTRIADLTQQDEHHLREINEIQTKFQSQLDQQSEKWQQKLLDLAEEKRAEMEALSSEFAAKEEKWTEAKKNLESQIRSLEAEAKEQAEMARAKNAKDLQLQANLKKLEFCRTEIESLNTVLEMKTNEIRSLREENRKQQQKLEEFDRMGQELREANASVEDLQAQLAAKNSLDRSELAMESPFINPFVTDHIKFQATVSREPKAEHDLGASQE